MKVKRPACPYGPMCCVLFSPPVPPLSLALPCRDPQQPRGRAHRADTGDRVTEPCARVAEIRALPRRRKLWRRSRPGWLAVDLRGRGRSGGAGGRSGDGGQLRHIVEEKGTADADSAPVEEKRSEATKSPVRPWCRARARYPLPRRPWPAPLA